MYPVLNMNNLFWHIFTFLVTQLPLLCKTKVDLAFLVDGSASAEYNSRGGFRRNLGLVKEFVRQFITSPNDARFGLVVFASEAGVEFTFDSHKTRDSLIADINSIKFPGTATYLGGGLTLANSHLFPKARTDAKQILVVLTDALSHDDIKTPSEAIKKRGKQLNFKI